MNLRVETGKKTESMKNEKYEYLFHEKSSYAVLRISLLRILLVGILAEKNPKKGEGRFQ